MKQVIKTLSAWGTVFKLKETIGVINGGDKVSTEFLGKKFSAENMEELRKICGAYCHGEYYALRFLNPEDMTESQKKRDGLFKLAIASVK